MFRRFCRPAAALASAFIAAGARVPQLPAARTLPAFVPVALALAAVCIATPSMATHGLAGALPGDVTTYHVDNLRTGWAQSETALTPATVGGPNFGLVAQVQLDEQVDAQPLYLGGVTIAGAVHDVVYVATENNTIYAIDAESGQILLSNNLGQAVPINVLPGYCNNNSYNMGVNSTPVIDRAAGLMYVMTYTFENAVPVFRIHAISLTTLQDTIPSVAISGTAKYGNGRTADFVSANNRQRAALLETAGNIYAGFASWCDINANVSRGWVLGWNTGTLNPLPVSELFNRRPKSPDTFFLSSVWMSGYGIASDDNGSLFLITGNSDYSGNTWNKTTNLAESVIRLSADLTTVQDFFTPKGGYDGWRYFDQVDDDFGAAGILLLPPQSGSTPNMAVAAGKGGPLYLMDRDNLGGLSRPNSKLDTAENDGCWCGQSYFTGADGKNRVVTSTGNTLRSYIVRTSPKPGLVLENTWRLNSGQDPGFFTSISSNGTAAASAIIWAIGRPTDTDPADVRLFAIDPAGTAIPIFSAVAGTWPFAGNANANIVPVVANGHVFVASYGNLSIFGLSAAHLQFRAPKRPEAIMFPGAPHELHGMVTAIDGTLVTLRLRNGQMVKVDTASAAHAFHVAPPAVGHASLVRGAYAKDGTFTAAYVLHQKDSQALWAVDH